MIHSTGSMPTGNFDEPVVPAPQPPDSRRSFRLPADYYSAPLAEVKPVFPSWVPWGCGAAAILALLLMFAGGALMTGERLAAFVDLMIGMTIGEVKKYYAADVTEAHKTAFDEAVSRMREGLRDSRISVEDVQPFLKEMQTSIGDEKVTAAELERLTTIATDAAR